MTAGLSTQSKTIQRVEAIAEKVPGGSDILKTQQEIIERQLLELEMQAKVCNQFIQKEEHQDRSLTEE